MCRIFSFRSILKSQMHQSLVHAENALINQSLKHPDGWGLAYYQNECPHLIKMDQSAGESSIFRKVSAVVRSETLLAHIRKSTVGHVGPLNTHPFQWGPWTFCHNGNLREFEKNRNRLLLKIDPQFRPFILGDTDSEHLFYLFLSRLQRQTSLKEPQLSEELLNKVLLDMLAIVEEIFGAMIPSKGDNDKNYLTFVATNGKVMLGFQGGQQLRYTTYKNKCSERDSCNFFKPICEAPAVEGQAVHHFLLSSEEIEGENEWDLLNFKQFVAVDQGMNFLKGQL